MSNARPATVMSFRDTATAGWVEHGGLDFNAVFIGQRLDADSPVAVVVRASRDVGDRVGGLRTHPTPCTTAVMDGAIQLDGQWMSAGGIQVAPAGVPHGDLVVGPDGAVFVIMFARRLGMVPTFTDPGDQHEFDSSLRQQVEEVASGKTERPVAILPLRDTHTPRRGIKLVDSDDIAQLTAAQG